MGRAVDRYSTLEEIADAAWACAFAELVKLSAEYDEVNPGRDSIDFVNWAERQVDAFRR